MDKIFPRPDLSAANPTICLAGVQALSEILPFFYRPTCYGLFHFFVLTLGDNLILSLTEKEMESILNECAAKGPNPADAMDSQLKEILENIYEAREPSYEFTKTILKIMIDSNLPRSDMACILVDDIAPCLSGEQIVEVYKTLPFVVPDLIQLLPLQQQDELFFEEQNPEHKALFLKKLGPRASKVNHLIQKVLSSNEPNSQAIAFIASLIKNQVVLSDVLFHVADVEDALVSERLWSPDAWGCLLQWQLDGPIQPCFVEQCRMDLAMADGREDSSGRVNLPRLEARFHRFDLIWMELQSRTKFPTYFDGTSNPEKRLHARYMYDACICHIQTAVNQSIAVDGDIGRIVAEYLFPVVDFTANYISPNVEFWSSDEVLLWWTQHLPSVCQEYAWMITDCRISGRDLFHIDESLLDQMELPEDAIAHVMLAIHKLKTDKSIRTLKSSSRKSSEQSVDTDALERWTNEDVLKWWKSALPQRCQKFMRAVRECKFEGKDLRVLDDDVLSTLGMKKLLRLKVLKALKVLCAAHSPKKPSKGKPRHRLENTEMITPLKIRTKRSNGVARRNSLMPQPRSLPAQRPAPSQRSSSVPIPRSSRPAPRFAVRDDSTLFSEKECNNCTLCKSKFSLFRRKHSCAFCCKIVCHSCSKRSLPFLEKKGLVQKRACDDCFVKISATAI